VLAYAGPNAGEQCPSMEVHKRISRVAQMLECMTRKILREGRDLADTVYELGQIDMKKSELGRELESMVKKCGNSADNSNSACQAQLKRITQEWQQVCGIRMTLMAKRDRQHADLFAFTHKFPTNAPDANTNYNKVCERELSRITSGKQSRIISQVTRMDKKTGRERTDRCALCMAVHDNAKCLATRKVGNRRWGSALTLCLSLFFFSLSLFLSLSLHTHTHTYTLDSLDTHRNADHEDNKSCSIRQR
jgi:hypothetical protein